MIGEGVRLSGFSNPAIHVLSEDGVSACPGRRVPKGRSAFQYFFEPVAEHLDELFLLAGHGQSVFVSGIAGDPGLGPAEMDAEWRRWVVELPEARRGAEPYGGSDLVLFRPGAFRRWGHTVNDDWCRIIGLQGPEVDATALATELISRDADKTGNSAFRQLAIEQSTAIISCVDGRAWEFHAASDHLVRVVSANAIESGFLVERLLAEECLGY